VPARRRAWRWLPAAVAAAGLLVGAVTGWTLFRDRDSRIEREYVAALERLGGKALAAGTLEDRSGRAVGRVFLYLGEQPSRSWVFAALEDPGADGTYSIEVRREGATPLVVPGLVVRGGRGSAGARIDLRSLRDVEGVALLDGGGDRRYVGRFDFG
jgi:hypothetical protein